MSLTPIREAARGRWRGILPALGIDSRFLSGKNGPCPQCGGVDRFRFDDKDGRGTWICSRCGAGDGLSLVMQTQGLPFRDAALRVEDLVSSAPRQEIPAERSEADKHDAMRRLWAGAGAVSLEDPVGRWLNRRTGLVSFPRALRYASRVRYAGSHHPAMLAAVQAPDGNGSTIHRTFLTEDGQKAAVDKPRMVMPGTIALGSAVRLFEAGPELGIAEGIETALAASNLFGVPCWSALNADMLSKWVPPEGVSSVVVYADHDASFTGQAAAFALARRLSVKDLAVRVMIPDAVDTDWNDVWLNQRGAA